MAGWGGQLLESDVQMSRKKDEKEDWFGAENEVSFCLGPVEVSALNGAPSSFLVELLVFHFFFTPP